MTVQNTRLGILLAIAAMAVFSVQDAFSRHLAGSYNTLMVVMVRYWFFAAFVLMLALRQKGGLRAMATRQPVLHFLRAALLITEVCVIVQSYTQIGLVQTHAVFASCPLLSALYSLMTRKAAALDASLVSLFWSGIIGALLMTPIGLFYWQPISGPDWGFMVLYGVMAVFANWLVIRAYELAEASALQPFAYRQLVFVSAIGVAVFQEEIRANVVIGAAIVVSAGLVTLVRSRGTRAVEAM